MEKVVERFLRYIKIDSESKSEKNFKEVLKKELEELGLEVYEDNAGEKVGSNSGNLIAKLKGSSDKTILFSAHMDTVVPGNGIKPIIENGVIRSSGDTVLGGDDKAGVAAIMEMLKTIKEDNIEHHNIEVAFTICEEIGLLGSKNLDYSKVNADYAIVFDSGHAPGYVVMQGPAQNKMDVVFKGKASHAGVAPEAGISAIKIAAEAIANMNLLRIDEETTANIGSINGGGPTNIVTDTVEIKAEARSLDNDKLKKQTEHMVNCVKEAQAKYGIEAEINIREAYKAFKMEEDSDIVKLVKNACDRAGLEFVSGKSGGGSDTNNYNLNGIPSVNLGVGMTKVHSVEEYIEEEHIVQSLKLALEIARI